MFFFEIARIVILHGWTLGEGFWFIFKPCVHESEG